MQILGRDEIEKFKEMPFTASYFSTALGSITDWMWSPGNLLRSPTC